jgi:hypothetical protein
MAGMVEPLMAEGDWPPGALRRLDRLLGNAR